MSDVPLVQKLVNSSDEHVGWVFWCPGCEDAHQFKVPPWTFNGDVHKPTVRASILVRGVDWSSGKKVETRCHSFVTDGEIRFLNDCTHALKGKTVPIESMPWDP